MLKLSVKLRRACCNPINLFIGKEQSGSAVAGIEVGVLCFHNVDTHHFKLFNQTAPGVNAIRVIAGTFIPDRDVHSATQTGYSTVIT